MTGIVSHFLFQDYLDTILWIKNEQNILFPAPDSILSDSDWLQSNTERPVHPIVASGTHLILTHFCILLLFPNFSEIATGWKLLWRARARVLSSPWHSWMVLPVAATCLAWYNLYRTALIPPLICFCRDIGTQSFNLTSSIYLPYQILTSYIYR